jgi:single-stranded DNA-binding protein
VYVEGRLRLSTWNTPEGQQRSRLEVVAQRVQFLPRASAPGTTLETVPVEPEGISQEENSNTETENSSEEDVPF